MSDEIALEQVRVVQLTSVWKGVGALTGFMAIALTVHSLFVLPTFTSAAREDSRKIVQEHAREGSHAGSASRANLADLKVQVRQLDQSVDEVLVQQGVVQEQLRALSEDISEMKRR